MPLPQTSSQIRNSFNGERKANSYDTIQSVVPMSRSSEFRSDLTMRLRINATPDATIRLLMDMHTGDYITLRGSGDIHATYYNKGGFNMFGTYEVSNGTYNITIQNIIKKNFIFQEGGTIVFSGDPYDAQIDMQAQHIVNGVSLSDLNIGRSFSNTGQDKLPDEYHRTATGSYLGF